MNSDDVRDGFPLIRSLEALMMNRSLRRKGVPFSSRKR
jgi:hypothetical protein